MHRREFLRQSGVALALALPSWGCQRSQEASTALARASSANFAGLDVAAVRADFQLDWSYVHLAALLFSSHPAPVREAIARHREGLDDNPTLYLEAHNVALDRAVRAAAARYLGADTEEIALTDSTTMGLGLVYNGIAVRPDQELLTTLHDYHVTHEALRLKAERTGCALRRVRLYDSVNTVSSDEVVERLTTAIRPNTRVVAVTWVHSNTGLKLPIAQIAHRLAELNRERGPEDRALLCVDGVHGLGVEPALVKRLQCDVFVAGTHKWLFGPRGTGIVWAHRRAHAQLAPTIPTFTRRDGWGGYNTPGGFHSFEHRWALAQAFEWHQRLGPEKITQHTHTLAAQLKAGLAEMPRVTLRTPLAAELSAGIVCFEVAHRSPLQVVRPEFDRSRYIEGTCTYRNSAGLGVA